ncbi:MAG: bifunctional folylpolyglutamate synthase/dihydrofolate synthase [Chthoniobacterales bacterium]
MTYREALTWLFGTQKFGIKLGLDNIERLLSELKIPRNGDFQIADGGLEAAAPWRIVHVAGTNGKGSVCAMIDSICRAADYRTGLFTSPHLVTFRERIQVDGEMIGEEEVARGLTTIRDLVSAWDPHPTFFEIATALGLIHFREFGCEIIVLETGMGGRLDSTNAVAPVVSVITPIALDHQKWLGHTLGEIASEKAGIIKPGVPVVAAPQSSEAERVLRARAAACGVQLTFVSEPIREGVGLAGEHQKWNAALAVAACRSAGISVDECAIRKGLAEVQWPARFQVFDGRVVIDGAHNPAGARALVETWREAFGDERATMIFGVLADKDAAASYRILSEIAGEMLLPQFRGERVRPPAELAQIVARITPEMECRTFASVARAIAFARNRRRRILVTGSLHLAGETLALLRGEPAAFEECAQ